MLNKIYKLGLMCIAVAFAACTPDAPVDPYFSIEEGKFNYSVSYEKVSKADSRTFTVRSNKSWEIVGVEKYDWLKPFPSKGEGDGRFYFVIDENITLSDREAVYSLVIDGKEYPTAITVSQTSRGEFVEASVSSFTVLAQETRVGLKIKTNVDIDYAVIEDNSGANGSWLSFPKYADMHPDSLYIKAAESTRKAPRTAKIAIYMQNKKSVADTISIMQVGTEELYGFPAKWTFSGAKVTDEYISSWSKNNSFRSNDDGLGMGILSYVASESVTRDISSDDPRVAGAWPEDYWLYEVPAIIPAGTSFQISFDAKASKTGQKFWMLEYFDADEWLPVGTVLTTSELGSSVSYTHAVGLAATNVSGAFRVMSSMTTLKIRFRCAANWTVGNEEDGTVSSALSARNGGTVRMTGEAGTPLEIKIVDNISSGTEAKIELSAPYVALDGASGAKKSISIKSSEPWKLTYNATWFEVSPTSGSADEKTTVTIKAKSAASSMREAIITLTSGNKTQSIGVVQTSNGSGSTPSEPDTPTEPEKPTSTDLHVEWLFSAATMSSYSGTFSDASTTTAAGDGGKVVKSNVQGNGTGTIKYYQVDKSGIGILSSKAPARTVGSTGHPFVYGAWPGDYWLFEATNGKEYPAGTKLNISFITRVHDTGQKYWKLEYWDGQEWKPAETLKSVEINGATVKYNFTPTSATSNSKVDFTWTLAKACTTMKFRYTCVANYGYDGTIYSGLNSGTCRIAGAEGTSPVFKVVK